MVMGWWSAAAPSDDLLIIELDAEVSESVNLTAEREDF
jgi:hypothetical protein